MMQNRKTKQPTNTPARTRRKASNLPDIENRFAKPYILLETVTSITKKLAALFKTIHPLNPFSHTSFGTILAKKKQTISKERTEM